MPSTVTPLSPVQVTSSLSTLTCSPLPSAAVLINQNLQSTLSTQARDRASLDFLSDDLERLSFFQETTCSTLGTLAIQKAYQKEIVRFALSVCYVAPVHWSSGQKLTNLLQRPYLMHVVLAMTNSHHRHLKDPTSKPSSVEERQISQALAHYNDRLRSPVNAVDSDALLATSTLINAFYFACTSGTNPSDSWPLKSSPTDLEWLGVQQGPGLIMAASSNWLSQSVFLASFSDFSLDSSISDSNDALSVDFAALCAFCDMTLHSTTTTIHSFYTCSCCHQCSP